MTLPTALLKLIPPAIIEATPAYFKNTAFGGGVLGCAAVMVFGKLCRLSVGAGVASKIEALILPLCVGFGLFHNQYPRFDDRTHLYVTALATCWAMHCSYSEFKVRCEYNDLNSSTVAEQIKKNRQARNSVIIEYPAIAAFTSLIATGLLELGRCAASHYNER